MDNQYNENHTDDYNEDKDKTKKKSWLRQFFKWTVYIIASLIVIITAYRLISTGMPKELKNYIIKTEKIEQAYSNLKDDFKIYKIKIRDTFSMGDALFADNIYYFENAESLQVTVRLKNSRLRELFEDYGEDNSTAFFVFYLKVSYVNPDINSTSELEETPYILDFDILDVTNQSVLGEPDDKYQYITMNFDDVKINYANTKVELYVFENSALDEIVFDEDEYDARFTLFDINMPKTKLNVKKFDLD